MYLTVTLLFDDAVLTLVIILIELYILLLFYLILYILLLRVWNYG